MENLDWRIDMIEFMITKTTSKGYQGPQLADLTEKLRILQDKRTQMSVQENIPKRPSNLAVFPGIESDSPPSGLSDAAQEYRPRTYQRQPLSKCDGCLMRKRSVNGNGICADCSKDLENEEEDPTAQTVAGRVRQRHQTQARAFSRLGRTLFDPSSPDNNRDGDSSSHTLPGLQTSTVNKIGAPTRFRMTRKCLNCLVIRPLSEFMELSDRQVYCKDCLTKIDENDIQSPMKCRRITEDAYKDWKQCHCRKQDILVNHDTCQFCHKRRMDYRMPLEASSDGELAAEEVGSQATRDRIESSTPPTSSAPFSGRNILSLKFTDEQVCARFQEICRSLDRNHDNIQSRGGPIYPRQAPIFGSDVSKVSSENCKSNMGCSEDADLATQSQGHLVSHESQPFTSESNSPYLSSGHPKTMTTATSASSLFSEVLEASEALLEPFMLNHPSIQAALAGVERAWKDVESARVSVLEQMFAKHHQHLEKARKRSDEAAEQAREKEAEVQMVEESGRALAEMLQQCKRMER